MLDDEELQRIYQWVDEIPLSRPKRSIARDFADGVLVAEIVAHYFPRLVELHNYSGANGYAQKIYNWSTLNQKVFKKLGFQVQKEEMDGLCNCQAQAVERLLKTLQMKMAKYGAKRAAAGGSPGEGDDNIAPSGGAPKATPRSVAAPGTRRSAGGGVESRMEQMGMQDGGMRELLAEKDLNIRELRETVDILEIKIQKLEQLVRLKDSKIATLQAKLQQQPPM